ncbi:MarR family winged helix-turn-helix transcriptional regulator [Gemmatimonas sp.]|uniref:MarR family winged helix-turn-helix transcriptional regulator n=1 Tax=Gemmatimonas sp. TaxID=1962908 RepID=UPI003DA4264A
MSKGEKKRRRALDAYWSLQRAAALAAARVDDAVQPFSLSASQYGVLDTLQHRGPVHQQELAEALGRSKAQMTAIIDALEARALVRRERHEVDRRYITVYLTEAGRVLLAEAGPARTDSILELMRELSGEQKTKLMRLCGRLLRVLDPLADADETPDERASPSVAAADDASDDDDDDDHVETETPIETSPN